MAPRPLAIVALKQLHKIKDADIITFSAKAVGKEAATLAPQCAEQKQLYPSRRYSVLFCILVLQGSLAVKMERQDAARES